jgi:hypothetical protein
MDIKDVVKEEDQEKAYATNYNKQNGKTTRQREKQMATVDPSLKNSDIHICTCKEKKNINRDKTKNKRTRRRPRPQMTTCS